MQNKELVKELHKPINRIFEKRKVHLSLIDNIWGTGLADMAIDKNIYCSIQIFISVIDIYSKYAWVVPLKDKKELQLLLLFKTQTNQNTNQIKSEQTKAVNFTIDQ